MEQLNKVEWWVQVIKIIDESESIIFRDKALVTFKTKLLAIGKGEVTIVLFYPQ